MIELKTIVVRDNNVFSAIVGDEIVLMSLDSGTYYSLRSTSRAIWDGLKDPVRVSDLCDFLASIYKTPLETVQSDTMAFLSLLEAQKMIEAQPAGTI
jgi:hypothetical protein